MNQAFPDVNTFLAMRQSLAPDRHRPRYHFLPPANWMNDPNGLIHWRGEYHLFYQHNPYAARHHRIHWGHAVSSDLVHWRDLPIALTPSPDHADKDGCWSGCAVVHDGIPTLFYSGVFPQTVCMATSTDGMVIWQKHEHNPVISTVPEGIEAGDPWEFRDPFLWQEGDHWYLLMGTRLVGKGGAILLYRSVDLTNWDYLHPLLCGDAQQLEPYWTGTIWECPNFFRVGDRYVLLVSFQHHETGTLLYTGWFSGDFTGEQFTPQAQGILEYGAHFYAPQILRDEHGRILMWGWLWEARTPGAQEAAGWAGVMSLPRVLDVAEGGELVVSPAPELKSLRQNHWHGEDIEVGEETAVYPLSQIQGDSLEIVVEIEPGQTAVFGLSVRCSPDGAEATHLICDLAHGQFTIDRENASLSRDVVRYVSPAHQVVRAAPLSLTSQRTIRLHVFLDRSVIEVFLDGRATLSSRIYPSRPDSLGVQLFCRQGDRVVFKSVDVWQMASIWAV